MKLQGVFTALVTPFDVEGNIDEQVLRNLVDQQIEKGISGLVPMGTTGESPTLNYDEHDRVIKIVIEHTNGRVPVIAGTGSNSTAEAVEITKHAKKSGADYTLQVAPYYNKPSQEGFYRHFKAVAEEAELPVIIYNIPGRTGKNIESDTILRLAELDMIVGVKEASGDLSQVMEIIRNTDETFSVLSGDDNVALPFIMLGGDGVISVASNLIPDVMASLCRTALDGDYDKARALHYRLMPLFKALFVDTNPVPIKYAMSKKGLLKAVYRLPMCEMSDDAKLIVDRVLSELQH